MAPWTAPAAPAFMIAAALAGVLVEVLAVAVLRALVETLLLATVVAVGGQVWLIV
jgi:hypothetical protein